VTPRTIALTYDDNPNEGVYDLLTLLKSYNATATFFPNAPHHYNTLKLDKYIHDAHATGHQIGLHTSVAPTVVQIIELMLSLGGTILT
jgi:peptidoglycan-N-acetylglucosamine deacetylase